MGHEGTPLTVRVMTPGLTPPTPLPRACALQSPCQYRPDSRHAPLHRHEFSRPAPRTPHPHSMATPPSSTLQLHLQHPRQPRPLPAPQLLGLINDLAPATSTAARQPFSQTHPIPDVAPPNPPPRP
ncbi:hypothetical protein chiPu_0004238 [Chiloscyllium punctatum]|uniref:Uncharacterized protein n=1 Tax=Chiloscyllium punctatum TaxID=137246 RepID=A0A401S623_CHIPU|nr:hypothetical protein [Chiloscyllium punctatum]